MKDEFLSHPSYLQRHAVVSFYILALALGAGVIYLVVRGVLPSELALASALSASLAGIIITAVMLVITTGPQNMSRTHHKIVYQPLSDAE